MRDDEHSNEEQAGRSAHPTEYPSDRPRVPVWVLVLLAIVLVFVWDFWPYIVKESRRAHVMQICKPGTLWANAERELHARGFNTRPASPASWRLIDWGRCYTSHLLYKALRFMPEDYQIRLMRAVPSPVMIFAVDTSGTIEKHVPVLNTF